MTIPKYDPFDYFNTPEYEFRWKKYLLEVYGLTESQVIRYEANMMKDRDQWHKKRNSFDGWNFFVLIIAAVLAFVVVIIIEWVLCILLNIEENSFGKNLISYCCTIVIISSIWALWSKEFITEWFDAWIECKYKVQTQHNALIEKYFEDCHWEWYNKFWKPLYERDIQQKK